MINSTDNWWFTREQSSENRFIRKHQREFAKYFLPKYLYSVKLAYVDETDKNILHVIGRVKPAYQSSKGETQKVEVDMGKYGVWKMNINLYGFISAKSK